MEWKPGTSTLTNAEWDWEAVIEYVKSVKRWEDKMKMTNRTKTSQENDPEDIGGQGSGLDVGKPRKYYSAAEREKLAVLRKYGYCL